MEIVNKRIPGDILKVLLGLHNEGHSDGVIAELAPIFALEHGDDREEVFADRVGEEILQNVERPQCKVIA